MNRLIKYIKNPSKILFKLDLNNLIRMNDKRYLEILYYNRLNKKLNLDNPQTFNEKLQWLKLYDRNPEYTKMVDKYEVKKYVADIIGEEYIIPTIGVYDGFDDINFEKLPNQFVMKCTHDSGSTTVCKDKNMLDTKETREKINRCLRINFYYHGREWPYKNVKPRIIIEEYIEGLNGEDLLDYKFMCFNGKVQCSFVCSDRFNKELGLAVDFFDRDWKHMPFKRKYRNTDKNIEKPRNYEKMIELAEKLSKNIPFVRVDFYEKNEKIYFGELTFYPGNGFEKFEPEEWDEKLGELITLPEKRKE